jgi:hypothetical protein
MNQKPTNFQIKTAFRGVNALAAELGVSRFHLSRVLNGHRFAGERLAGELAARGVCVRVRGNEKSSTSPADRTHESASLGLPAVETSSTSPAGRSLESDSLAGPAGKTSSDSKSMPAPRRLSTPALDRRGENFH